MKEFKLVSNLKIWDRSEIKEGDMLKMIEAASNASELAYAPYSKFKVGVAILMVDGNIVLGANQENASYPICICAESITLGAAKTQYPNGKIAKIFIYVPSSDSPVSPCGMCRQAILEYEKRQGSQIEIYLIGKDEMLQIDGIQSILPLAFDGSKLSGLS